MISISNSLQYGPYVLCGWHVESALPLPELTVWNESQERNAEGTIRIELQESAPFDTAAGFCTNSDNGVLLRVKGVAGFRVNPEADHVTVHPEEGVDPMLLRAYLFGSVLAILCYRRGLFPLHGSCVLLGDEAVVFSGASGAGKSTLATALARRGHPLLCDDVCAIDLSNPRRPMLRPAFPRVKLLPDAIDCFQMGEAVTYSQSMRGPKGHFGMATMQTVEAIQQSIPLGAIYALDAPAGERASRFLLRGKNAFAFIESQAHRGWMGRKLGLGGQLFGHIASLAATVPVYRLDRPCALDRVDEIACLVEAEHNAVGMLT
ncbi:MAG TPA: hypothetical protein VFW25_05240 [Silvibacterium sp.]|nr:hypothetical protein [Silvibacterium sp.]